MKNMKITERRQQMFRLPRWNELPGIDLYLDQVLTLMDDWLGEYMGKDGSGVMTKTMVNNYVKQHIIEAPVKKRYDKTAVASLFVIAILKPVYTISEISLLMKEAIDASDKEASYNYFCGLTERAVNHAFEGTEPGAEMDERDPRRLFWNVCNSFASQLYVRNMFLKQTKDIADVSK